MTTTRASRWASALVLGALSLAAMSAPAVAQPSAASLAAVPTAAVTADPNPALITPDALGSLTFHKYLVPGLGPDALPGTGAPSPVPADAKPLAGVVFTVTRVEGVDLTTNEGWLQASAYQNGGIALAREHLGAGITSVPTGADGTTVVSGLPLGLYLVHEAQVLTSTGDHDPSVITAADFLVTVPMTDPTTRDRWMYDLHLYPKNSRVALTKTVADGDAGVANHDAPVAGTVLTYTLSADIPGDGLRAFGGRCERDGAIDTAPGLDEFGFTAAGSCASGATYIGTAAGAAYEIIDDLATAEVPDSDPVTHASDYLEFSADGWAGVVAVSLTGAKAPLTACAAGTSTGCDYILTRTASSVAVAMTDRGLAALAAAKAASPTAQVTVTLEARVRDGVDAATLDGVLTVPNTGRLIPTGLAKARGTSVPSNTVRTIYATLRLHKVDKKSGDGLAGAVFTLYRTQADAAAGRNPLATSTATGADGLATFAGIHVTDFQNDTTDNDSYWVVESTAPSGYIGLTAPLQVRLHSDGTTDGADRSGGLPITNQKLTTPGGALAFTGTDVGWLLAAGLGLVLLGIAFAAVARRRAHSDEQDAHA